MSVAPPPEPRPHLAGLSPERLSALLESRGVPAPLPQTRKLLARVLSGGDRELGRPWPPGLSRRVVEGVERHTRRGRLEVVERAEDPSDGFVKYLFRLDDGAVVEAVRIPLHKPGHFTVCLSSQVGCAMGCVFCATGRLGLTRNLRAWEMVEQWLTVRDEAPGRVTGAVFMGQGEPLHNYDEVIAAAGMLSEPCVGRIAQEAISISTVGLVPQIRRYADEGHRYRLIVSLTSADPALRRALLPVAGRFELDDLADAIRRYAAGAKGLVTIAWVVLGGVNTSEDEVRRLRALLGDLPIRVNLIDVNDAREGGFRRADPAELAAFLDALQLLGAPIVRRYSGGRARHAACGMLAAKRLSAEV